MTRFLLSITCCVISQIVIKLDGLKRGEAFGTAIEVDCQMLTRRLERGGGTSEINLALNNI